MRCPTKPLHRGLESEELALLTRHEVAVCVREEELWRVLMAFGRRQERGSDPAAPGPSLAFFQHLEATPPSLLVLSGSHALARYALMLHVGGDGKRQTTLTAESRASFTGRIGGFYRTLVVSSGAHALGVRLLLLRLKRAAERRH